MMTFSDHAELEARRKLEETSGMRAYVKRWNLAGCTDKKGNRIYNDMYVTMVEIPGTGIFISAGGVEIGK